MVSEAGKVQVKDYNDIFQAEYFIYFWEKLYPEDRIAKEVDFIIDRLKLKPHQSILDLPCGFGAHANLFAKRGFQVTGVDLNQTFLDKAQLDAEQMEVASLYIQEDMRDFLQKEAFDCILMLQTSWGYFSDEENRRVLENVSMSLKQGGFFVLDMLNPALFDQLPKGFKDCAAFDIENNLMIDWRSYDKETSRAEVKRVYIKDGKRKDAKITIQMLTLGEIKNTLYGLGMNFVAVYGNYKGDPFEDTTSRMVIICQKSQKSI